jgi:5-methylcytosine-specific restriction endonuclease McrBC GTP-binding regulatory subunit McrB
VAAWKDTTKPVYLVIEEINRGNCAQIFGDLFQLLDRGEDGKSEYSIKADKDLRKYLESDKGLGKDHEGIKNGELCLPANLRIYATMNTSDQSLFPMDSAFKRRWEWEYVPIDPDNADSQFIITIADKKYAWKDFLLAANERVKDVSESEDKQMGNFFIKDHIGKDEFVSKVMFYLWSEVCKDEYRARSFFHYKDGNNDEFSFNELFQKDENGVKKDVALLQGFMNYLGVKEI